MHNSFEQAAGAKNCAPKRIEMRRPGAVHRMEFQQ
jgi:hypothetical protein